ncbi:hypothetical protein SRHO_G00177320 [Serrasalmus rhombeus]
MKILLIFTLYLISGQVGCSDVIGYPGGIVQIYCYHEKHEVFNEYFCKVTPRECLYIDVQNPWRQRGRSNYDYETINSLNNNISQKNINDSVLQEPNKSITNNSI